MKALNPVIDLDWLEVRMKGILLTTSNYTVKLFLEGLNFITPLRVFQLYTSLISTLLFRSCL
jgi:hypothetical protein